MCWDRLTISMVICLDAASNAWESSVQVAQVLSRTDMVEQTCIEAVVGTRVENYVSATSLCKAAEPVRLLYTHAAPC